MIGLRILVIDDSLTIRKLVEISLRDTPHVIDYASTGATGIARATETGPDLVLCDYVLPDTKGIDVCRAVHADRRSARSALVIMSGKHEQIRPQFAELPVRAFLGKPFTTDELRRVVGEIAATRQSAFATSRDNANALAASFRNALYDALCARLTRIPSWMPELGSEAPATFFARKLLNDQALAELFEALVPVYEQLAAKPRDRQLLAQGSLDVIAPGRLIHLAAVTDLASELAFTTDHGAVAVLVARGRLFAKGGQSAREVAALLRGRSGTFRWRRLEIEPDPPAGNALHLAQLQLECARVRTDAPRPAPTTPVERSPGFSARVQELALDPVEQQLATLVDGQATVEELARRAGLAGAAAEAIVARLVEIDLLRLPASAPRATVRRTVVVAEPDHAAFRGPLTRHLATRHPGIAVEWHTGDLDVDDLLARRPDVIVVNATAHADAALRLARRCADGPIRLVAIVELATPRADDLTAAGFHAVVAKPVHLHELEWLVTGQPIVTPTHARGLP